MMKKLQLTALLLATLARVCSAGVFMYCGDTFAGSTVGQPNVVGNPAGDFIIELIYTEGYTAFAFSTCSNATNFNTYLRVFESPEFETARVVAANDDDLSCPISHLHSRVEVEHTGWVSYLVVVEGFESNEGDFEISLTCTPTPTGHTPTRTPPVITCGDTIIGSTIGLPNVVGNPARDSIFEFIYPEGYTAFAFSTCSHTTNFDTYLRVFEDDTLGTAIAVNDDSYCPVSILFSRVEVDHTGSANFFLVVEGYDTREGIFELSVTCTPIQRDACNPIPTGRMSTSHAAALDGNLNYGGHVEFDAAALPAYIDITFDAPTKVCALGIVTDWHLKIPSGRIAYSTDGSTFAVARLYATTKSGQSPPYYTPVEQNTFELPELQPMLKLRLYIDNASQFPVLIFELKVWSSPPLSSDYFTCSTLPDYWKQTASASNVDPCRIGYNTTEGQWYIDDEPACVAFGASSNVPCNTDFFCAGADGTVTGYGDQQMGTLAKMIAGDFRQHSLCPVCPPTQGAGFIDVCLSGSVHSIAVGNMLPGDIGTPGSVAWAGRGNWLSCDCTEVHIGHHIPGAGSYWYDLAESYGLNGDLVTHYNDVWYYDAKYSCVGKGVRSSMCDRTVNYCAGSDGITFGYGAQQMTALKNASELTSGTHALCPLA